MSSDLKVELDLPKISTVQKQVLDKLAGFEKVIEKFTDACFQEYSVLEQKVSIVCIISDLPVSRRSGGSEAGLGKKPRN